MKFAPSFLNCTVCAALLFSVQIAKAESKPVISTTNTIPYCHVLAKKLPQKTSGIKNIAPLLQEKITPDLDYCSDDFSKCEIRNLIFHGLELRLLHQKNTGEALILTATFSSQNWTLLPSLQVGQSLSSLEQVFGASAPKNATSFSYCGESCIDIKLLSGHVSEIHLDCQAGI